MRKVLFVAFTLAMLAVSAVGQTLVQRKTIKSINFGVLKLERAIVEKDTTYMMLISTTNKYHPYVSVALGDRENAKRLFKVLIDVKLNDDDVMMLENETNNIVGRGVFGSLRFWSEGRAFSGDVGKTYLKKFLSALDDNAESDDGGGRKRKQKE